MFTPRRSTADIVLPDGALDDQDQGWDAVLRELATEPGLDMPVAPRAAVATAGPVTVDLPASGSRAFGGLWDVLLVAAAVLMGVLVAALGVAVISST